VLTLGSCWVCVSGSSIIPPDDTLVVKAKEEQNKKQTKKTTKKTTFTISLHHATNHTAQGVQGGQEAEILRAAGANRNVHCPCKFAP